MVNKKYYTLACLIIFFATFIPVYAGANPFNNSQLLPSERENIDVFKKVSPLVVNVHNIKKVVGRNFNVFDIPTNSGSGFIWDKKGHIVTNFHVIAGANNVVISTADGKTMPAKVIGAEPRKDIAVLKLTSSDDIKSIQHYTPLEVADSSKLLVGQRAIAIGNPFGLDQTMTAGIVSALNRRINGVGGVSIRNMIQTDASINPGNSGGPLLDGHGRLIGMNTVIYSTSGTSAGIGFAVPSNAIKAIVTQITKNGKVIQPGLGIQILGDHIAKQLGVKGVIIAEIIPHSPADKADLEGTYRDPYGRIHIGDIIIAIDDKTVKDYDDLYNIISSKNVGSEITIKFIRDGKTRVATLKTVDISEIE